MICARTHLEETGRGGADHLRDGTADSLNARFVVDYDSKDRSVPVMRCWVNGDSQSYYRIEKRLRGVVSHSRRGWGGGAYRREGGAG